MLFFRSYSNALLHDAYQYYVHNPTAVHNWKNTVEQYIQAAKLTLPSTNSSCKAKLKDLANNIKCNLQEQYTQSFFATINKSTTTGKLTLYRQLYKEYSLQDYLSIRNKKHKQTIARLRTSTHRLEIEKGRHGKKVVDRDNF